MASTGKSVYNLSKNFHLLKENSLNIGEGSVYKSGHLLLWGIKPSFRSGSNANNNHDTAEWSVSKTNKRIGTKKEGRSYGFQE
jgi:hypothetical protein